MTTITRSACAALLAAFALPAVAGAHVTIQPEQAEAGAYVVQSIRVPNERDDAATTKVEVQLPDGFASLSYAPVPGWRVTVQRAKLATPIQTEDGEVTEAVRQITWTAQGDGGIEPGQFIDFPISVKIPEGEDELTFKALQTYEGGEVVRWIGAPDSDKPAPVLTVTDGEDQDLHSEQTQEAAPSATAAPPSEDEEDDDEDNLAVIALAVGALGLAAGALGLVTARRKEST